MFVAAYDDAGECLWANGVGGDLGATEILIDGASGIHVIGTNPYSVVFPGVVPTTVLPGGFIAKYDMAGELLSAERVLRNGEFNHASWVGSNEWVLTGFVSSGSELYGTPIEVGSPVTDGFVARTTTDGTVAWVTQFRSSNTAEVWECAATLTGQINVAGYFLDSLFLENDTLLGPPGVYSFFLASLSASGEVEWVTPIRSETQAFVYDLKIGPTGDIYAFGRFMGTLNLGDKILQPRNSINGYVARFDPLGECHAAWSFGRLDLGDGSVLPTSDGLLVACDYDSAMVVGTEIIPVTQTGSPDLFIAQFDSLSGFTGVQSLALEGNNTLHIYANPSNGLCTVELPDAITPGSDLVLSIYDVQGRMVQQAPLLIQQGTVQLDIQAQARGTYHVVLQDGTKRYTGTIVFE